MTDSAKEAWSKVGERFGSWGRRVADHYRSAGSKGDGDGGRDGWDGTAPAEPEGELKRTVKSLVDELSRGFSAVNETIRDDTARRELADAVSAIGDAVTATVEETTGAIRGGNESTRRSSAPAAEPDEGGSSEATSGDGAAGSSEVASSEEEAESDDDDDAGSTEGPAR